MIKMDTKIFRSKGLVLVVFLVGMILYQPGFSWASADSDVVNFEGVEVNTSKSIPIYVYNKNRNRTMNIDLSFMNGESDFSVSPESMELLPGEGVMVSITYNPSTIGESFDNLRLSYGEDKTESVTLQGQGVADEEIIRDAD
jgi:hypothetical protein